jgi:hypothetical protein
MSTSARFVGRVRHGDKRYEWKTGDGEPDYHVFRGKDYRWTQSDNGDLHVVSRGAGEEAEEALGFHSTEGKHAPGNEKDRGKPWDKPHAGAGARDSEPPRPPRVGGTGSDSSARGLNEYFSAYYSRKPAA